MAAIGSQPDFEDLSFTIDNSRFPYGHFLNAVIAFLVIAATIYFLVVKSANALMERRKRGEEPEVMATREDIVLLQEIRDIVRSQTSR